MTNLQVLIFLKGAARAKSLGVRGQSMYLRFFIYTRSSRVLTVDRPMPQDISPQVGVIGPTDFAS